MILTKFFNIQPQTLIKNYCGLTLNFFFYSTIITYNYSRIQFFYRQLLKKNSNKMSIKSSKRVKII